MKSVERISLIIIIFTENYLMIPFFFQVKIQNPTLFYNILNIYFGGFWSREVTKHNDGLW